MHAKKKIESPSSKVVQKAQVGLGCLYSVDWNGPLDYWNGLLEHWNGILEWITGMATYLTRCSLGGKAGLGPDSNYSNVYFITAMYLAFRLTAHTLNR